MKRGGKKADAADQRELLDRLRIDRSDDDDDDEGGGRWWIVLFMFVCVAGAAGLIYVYWWPKPPSDTSVADTTRDSFSFRLHHRAAARNGVGRNHGPRF